MRRPCSRAGATLRHGSPEPSEWGVALPPADAKWAGQPMPQPAWSRLQPGSAPGFPSRPAGPQSGGGAGGPGVGFQPEQPVVRPGEGSGGGRAPHGRPEGPLPWATRRALTAPDTAQPPRGAAPAPSAGPSAYVPLLPSGSKEQSGPGVCPACCRDDKVVWGIAADTSWAGWGAFVSLVMHGERNWGFLGNP